MKHFVNLGVLLVSMTAAGVRVHAQPARPAPPDPAKGRREVKLTAADAVRSALAHHPDVVKLKLDVDIADAEVTRQEGEFRPVLTARAAQRQEGVYTASVVAGADSPAAATSRTTLFESAVTGRTTFGGAYAVGLSGSRIGNFSLGSTLLPIYQTAASVRYTQSLLRGAGSTPNRGIIERAEFAEEASRVEHENRRLALALEVLAGYWSLVVRREQVTIREASLSEAKDLRELVLRRIRGGQAAKSDAVQADATVGEREQLLRQAHLQVVEGERQLLALTYLNRDGTFRWDDVLVPVETARDAPAKINFETELATALRERPEIKRIEKALALARLDHRIAANNSRMRLDLYAEGGVLGLAGTPVAGTMNPPVIVGGFTKATTNMVTGEAPFFELGVQLEIPLGNAARVSAEEQAKLRVDKVLAEDVRTQIALDVRAAHQALEIAIARLRGAKTVADLSEQNVDAQRKRYESGAATIFDTLRVQDELARAQAEVVLAAAEQEVALARLQAARGTLLEQYGVTTESK